MANRAVWLTTSDNGYVDKHGEFHLYNPILDYENWEKIDSTKKYFCNQVLARHCFISEDSLSDEENEKLIEDAIDEIVLNQFKFGTFPVDQELGKLSEYKKFVYNY